MQPRRQHQITRIRKPLIVSRGWIHLHYTRIAVAFGQVSRETGGGGGDELSPGCQKLSCAVSGFRQVFIVETKTVVCYTAVFRVVTQCSSPLWGGALRDNTKNGCVADYEDGGSNENGKKALSLLSKTTTLHVQHTFLVHFCFHCATTTWKSPDFKSVCGGRELKTKFEAAWLHFLSDVFVAVAVVVVYAPLCPARKASHGTRTRLRLNRFSPDFGPDSWLAPNDHLPG